MQTDTVLEKTEFYILICRQQEVNCVPHRVDLDKEDLKAHCDTFLPTRLHLLHT